ncbi:MAG: adenylate/guanylate cyclase domain-containing protein [Polyangiaceae bacterium]
MSLLDRLLQLGTSADLGPATERRVRLCNACSLIATASTLAFGSFFAIASPFFYWKMLALSAVSAALMASALLWNARAHHRAARVVVMTSANLHVALGCLLVGRDLDFQSYFFLFPPVTLLLMPGASERAWRWAIAALSPASYLFVEHHPWTATGATPVPEAWHAPLGAVTSALVFVTLALIVGFFYQTILVAEADLAKEHERSEGLLHNILPRAIARRLKRDRAAIADGFAEVSVLFADIVGFTELSARMPPSDLVALLNKLFSELDDLAERRGLEKIKTIGDAYMVASGLPEPRPDHAEALVLFALDMLEVATRWGKESGHPLALRIGVHAGPVVAGVIGKRKFIYDLWGDTVNIASRMESHGAPGRIQVTEDVAKLLPAAIRLSEPRSVQVKGRGEMTTRFVLGRGA